MKAFGDLGWSRRDFDFGEAITGAEIAYKQER